MAAFSPRAISSICVCMPPDIVSRSCSIAASEPDALVLPPTPVAIGTPSTRMPLPVTPAS